ncbi:MAG: metallophosphoesterase family protein [Nanoarchaeota archaeon]|nr:metallophosphoesterase family protein [Nanoarchaeota archaeon]
MPPKAKKKLKILAASDLHGDSDLVQKLAKKAEKENVDLVVLCGDITGWTETKNIIKPFKDKNKHVLLIPGNWDSFATADFLANIYGMKNIHGYSVTYENIGFFGAGGAIGPGPGATTEKEIFDTLKRAHADLKGIEKKIMVTHMHPAGSTSEFSGVPGSDAIKKAIKLFKPDILLHGHIHEGAGIEEKINGTKVINVGRQGKIIEI